MFIVGLSALLGQAPGLRHSARHLVDAPHIFVELHELNTELLCWTEDSGM